MPRDTNRYPPLSPDELRDCHGYDNLERVVVTQHGVYGRSRGVGWIGLQPLAELNAWPGGDLSIDMMAMFKVGTTPQGARVWWAMGSPHSVQPNYADIRDATSEEAALMERVIRDRDTSADLDTIKTLIEAR